jgi:hypothetical protein
MMLGFELILHDLTMLTPVNVPRSKTLTLKTWGLHYKTFKAAIISVA